ncbi:hypothetical protein SLS62_002380 [Diatrype stigma]|uniref:Alpha/beta hydrolase fold-3 domain-containing protein n=1 Tax=Diatrype stigma TaxID=117547 RepID=A0AAN9UZ36_9PEZI
MDFSQYGTPTEEWVEFLKSHSEAAGFMPDKENRTPAELQAQVNVLIAQQSRTKLQASGLWNVVESEDYTVAGRDGNTISLRCYRPKAAVATGKPLPAYIYFHGGGFLFGNLESDEPMCVAWAHALSIAVVSVNYRHTPQASGLAAWHDAIDAFEWIAGHASTTLGLDPSSLTVGGISAGAALAAAVAVHDARTARDGGTPPRLRGQVLAIPSLMQDLPTDLFADRAKTSPVQCADAALLNEDWLGYFLGLLHVDTDVPRDHPTWNPGLVEEELLPYVPRTAVLVSGGDPLRDQGLLYATRLKEAGAKTKVHIFQGLPHGFYNFEQLSATKRWEEVMHESIRWAGANEGDWFVEASPQQP